MFLASNTFWTGSLVVRSSCCIGLTIDSRWLRSKAECCFYRNSCTILFGPRKGDILRYQSLRTAFYTLKLLLQPVAVLCIPCSCATATFDKWLDLNESCDNLFAHVSSSVEQADRFSVPTAVQCIPWTIVRRPFPHESNQQKISTMYLGCACAMYLALPLLRDWRNRLHKMVVGFVSSRTHPLHYTLYTPQLAFWNCRNRVFKAISSMTMVASVVVFLSGSPRHWQKMNCSSFSPWHVGHSSGLDIGPLGTRLEIGPLTLLQQQQLYSILFPLSRQKYLSRSWDRALYHALVKGNTEAVWTVGVSSLFNSVLVSL